MKTQLLKLILLSLVLLLDVALVNANVISLSSVTTNPNTNGLIASPVYPQNGIVVYGLALSNDAGAVSLNGVSIPSGFSNLNSLFGNAKLFISTNSTYSSGTSTQIAGAGVTGPGVTINAGSIVFTGLVSQTVPSSATRYLYLMLDYTYTGSSTFANNLFFNPVVSYASTTATNYAGSPYYEFRPTTINYSSVTTGLTAAGTGIYPQNALILYGFSAAMAGGTGTATTFAISNSGNSALPTYFTTAKLYRNTTNTYVGATPVTGAVPSIVGNTITFTGFSQPLTTTTVYYYLVMDYSYTGTGSSSVQFNSVTSNFAMNPTNVSGTFYNLLASTVSVSNNTGGLTSNAASIAPGTTALAMFSFSITVKGNATFSGFNINSSSNTTSNAANYLANGKLYVSSNATYPTGSSLIASGTSVVVNGAFVNITGLTQAFTGAQAGTTLYYTFVADYIVYTGINPGSITFNFTSGQSSNQLIQSAPAANTYNTFSATGNPYTFRNTVAITSYTGATNGFSSTTLNYLDNSVVYAFGVNVVGTLTINRMNIYATSTTGSVVNTYFDSGTLFSSNDQNFANATQVAGATIDINAFAGGFAVNSITEAITNSSKFYFIKLNYGNINAAGGDITFKMTTLQTNLGLVQTTPSVGYNPATDQSGPTLNMGRTYDWAGQNSSFTDANNFKNLNNGPGAVPSQYDQVRIGVVAYSNNNKVDPTIALGVGTLNLAKITFGTFDTPVLTVTGTVGTLNLSGGLSSVTGSSGVLVGTNNLIVLGANAVSSIAGSLTLTGGGYTNNGSLTIATASTLTHSTSLTGFTNAGVVNINGTGAYNEVSVLNNSGTFNMNGTGTINVDGNLTNTGVMTMAGGNMTVASATFANNTPGTFMATGGTVNFDFAGAQAINNTTVAAGAVTFNNLTASISGTKTLGGAGSAFEVNSTGLVSVTTTSTTILAAGTAKLTLNSDASGSANVDKLLTGTSISGTVNVERYLTGGSSSSRGYRLLSSAVSVSNASLILPNLTYIKTSAYTTGTGGPTNGFDVAGNPTLYFYRDNLAPNNSSFLSSNFRGVKTINATSTFTIDNDAGNFSLPAGNGFLFFFRGNRASNATTNTAAIAQTATFSNTGYLNQGSITVKHWTTNANGLLNSSTTGNANVKGYNLIGNPYASSIDWDGSGITNNSIGTTIWVYNPTLKVYATYVKTNNGVGTNFNGPTGTANIIPSGQGFFVRANGSNPSVTFTEQAKVTSQVASPTLLLSTAAVDVVEPLKYLRVQLYKDSLNREDALIFLKNSSKETFVEDEDAEYLRGNNTVTMSTISIDKKNLAINAIPLPKTTQTVLPLNANIATTGLYQINLTEAKNLPQLYEVYLMDALKTDSLDVLTHTTYNFNAVAGDSTTFGTKRFKLVIRQKAGMALRLLDFSAAKVTSGAQLSWVAENESNYTNYTVERSIDGGKTFEVIGGLLSSQLGKYTLLDKAPVIGQNQYRLKQDDINGTISYSKIVNLMYSNTSSNIMVNNLSIYPNPASSVISVAVTPQPSATSYKITITNGIGLVVKSATSSQPTWQDNVNNLLPGTYFVQVSNNITKAIVGNGKFIKN